MKTENESYWLVCTAFGVMCGFVGMTIHNYLAIPFALTGFGVMFVLLSWMLEC